MVRSASPDVLVHAAWHVTPGSYLSDPGNVGDLQASLDLFERARLAGCRRVIGVGTCLEYDTRRGWLDEQTALRPASMYASAKAALYLTATAWARERHVSFAWPRLFHLYGPGEDRRRLVPSVATSLIAGLPVVVAHADHVRDFLYVDDVADAVATVALSEMEGPVNVGSGVPIQVGSVVACLEGQLNRPGLIQMGSRTEDASGLEFICANTDRLNYELGWRPAISLDVGIMRSVAWWQCQARNGTEHEGAPKP